MKIPVTRWVNDPMLITKDNGAKLGELLEFKFEMIDW